MKINFNDTVDLRFFSDNKNKKLLNNLYVRTKNIKGLDISEYFVFKINKGMITDGASIPRILWTILSPLDNRILFPSQAHDFIYSNNEIEGWIWDKEKNKIIKKEKIKLTRKQADRILKEKMKSYNSGPTLRQLVYLSVRFFGEKYFSKNNK